MTDPFEDSWSDLAAEFGIDAPKMKPPEPQHEPEPEIVTGTDNDIEPAPTDLSESLFADLAMPDAHDEADGNDTEVIEAGGEPLTPAEEAEKKRRRRRRRRGKKGDAAPVLNAEGVEVDADDTPAATATDDGLAQPRELLREIIGNWDVPSWDEIVAGLHRPNR